MIGNHGAARALTIWWAQHAISEIHIPKMCAIQQWCHRNYEDGKVLPWASCSAISRSIYLDSEWWIPTLANILSGGYVWCRAPSKTLSRQINTVKVFILHRKDGQVITVLFSWYMYASISDYLHLTWNSGWNDTAFNWLGTDCFSL